MKILLEIELEQKTKRFNATLQKKHFIKKGMKILQTLKLN